MVTFGVNKTPETVSFQEEIRILVRGFRDFCAHLFCPSTFGSGMRSVLHGGRVYREHCAPYSAQETGGK